MDTQNSAPVVTQPTPSNTPNTGGVGTSQNEKPNTQGPPQSGATAKSITQAAEAKPQAQSQPTEYFDVKVNGKVHKMTKQEVLDLASMSHAANQKFDEASKQRKSVEKIISTAKENPIQVLMDPALGLSKDQVRHAVEQWYYQEFVETEALSPDKKRIRELEAIVNKSKAEQEEKQQLQKETEEAELTNKQRTFLQDQIIEGLEKSGLPKSKEIVKRMAFYMRQNLLNGWDAPIELIIRQVKQDHQTMVRDDVQNASIDQIIELYGEDLVSKIRQWDLKRLREKRQNPTPDFAKPQRGSDGYGNQERISSTEVNRRLKEMRTGKKLF